MSSISSVSSANAWAGYTGTKNTQTTKVASVVDELFNKLDTKQQGYLDKSELQSALTSAASNSNNGITANADQMFAAMDTNGDGKITKEELSNTLQSLVDKMDGLGAQMRAHGGHHKGGGDQGFTQDQLTQMAQNSSGTDSNRAKLMSSIAQNFSQADTNGDGKVNREEAMAYAKTNGLEMPSGPKGTQGAGSSSPDAAGGSAATADASAATATSQTTAAQSLSEQVALQIMQLVKAYGLGEASGGDTVDTSSAVSASA